MQNKLEWFFLWRVHTVTTPSFTVNELSNEPGLVVRFGDNHLNV